MDQACPELTPLENTETRSCANNFKGGSSWLYMCLLSFHLRLIADLTEFGDLGVPK